MISNAKGPFGTANFSKIKNARYLGGMEPMGIERHRLPPRNRPREVDGQQLRQDAFEVEFEEGLS